MPKSRGLNGGILEIWCAQDGHFFRLTFSSPNAPQKGCLCTGMMCHDQLGLGGGGGAIQSRLHWGGILYDAARRRATLQTQKKKRLSSFPEEQRRAASCSVFGLQPVQRSTALIFDVIQSVHRRGHRRQSLVHLTQLNLHRERSRGFAQPASHSGSRRSSRCASIVRCASEYVPRRARTLRLCSSRLFRSWSTTRLCGMINVVVSTAVRSI